MSSVCEERAVRVMMSSVLLIFGLTLPIAASAFDEVGSFCKCNRSLELVDHSFGKSHPIVVDDVSVLPQNFDWSNVAGINYLVPSWNQHIPVYCGSCYAHGTLAAIQDRIKISKGAKPPDVMLSRQSFLNCAPHYNMGFGCHGGSPGDVYSFMHDIGLPDETCNNYVANTTSNCTLESMCMNCMVVEGGEIECWPVTNFTKYYVIEYGHISGEKDIMSELYHRGPVTCSFITDENFDFNYRGGVWRQEVVNLDASKVNHDVEVTGWGITKDGIKFWQVRNSWGTYWGEGGFFKIERGINLNLFEDSCFFALIDSSEEMKLLKGELVGSLHGLNPKSQELAQQSIDYWNEISTFDWFADNTVKPMSLMSQQSSRSKLQPAEVRAGKFTSMLVVCIISGVLLLLAAKKISAALKRRGQYENIEFGPNR